MKSEIKNNSSMSTRITYDIEEQILTTASSQSLLTWQVIHSDSPGDNFTVNLAPLAFGDSARAPIVSCHRTLEARNRKKVRGYSYSVTVALASVIQEWSKEVRLRSATEGLSCLMTFFEFLNSRPDVYKEPTEKGDPFDFNRIGTKVGIEYAQWLRIKPKITNQRRNALYCATKSFLDRALQAKAWRPSPFSSAKESEIEREVAAPLDEVKHISAINKALKSQLIVYRDTRSRELKRIKNSGLRQPLLAQVQSQLQGNDGDFEPLKENSLKLARAIYPTEAVALSVFQLALHNLAINEQPLLDLAPNWKNPHRHADAERRTIIVNKNRKGRARKGPMDTKPLELEVKAKPRFHPFKLLRFYELLAAPLRRLLEQRIKQISEKTDKKSKKEKTRLAAVRNRFWLYIDPQGNFNDLRGSRTHNIANKLLAEMSECDASLLDEAGQPPRYRAKPARSEFHAFVQKKTKFNQTSVQSLLGHEEGSPAIQAYLSHLWARDYVREEHLTYQNAMSDILRAPSGNLSPKIIRLRLEEPPKKKAPSKKRVGVPERYKNNKVRHGFYCKTPDGPPSEISRLKDKADVCPADDCWQCPSRRCFDASLPELAVDIISLRRQIESSPVHLREGSHLQEKLSSLETEFGEWPESKRVAAMELASSFPEVSLDLS